MHVAPAFELRDLHALRPREGRVAEEERGLRRVALAFGNDLHFRAVGLERGLQEARGLVQALGQRGRGQRVGHDNLVSRFPVAQEHEIGGVGGRE